MLNKRADEEVVSSRTCWLSRRHTSLWGRWWGSQMPADAERGRGQSCLRLYRRGTTPRKPRRNKNLSYNVLFIHYYANVTKELNVETLCLVIDSIFSSFKEKEMLPELECNATAAGRGQPTRMRIESTNPRHLLKEVMLMNCRYDSAWLRFEGLYQYITPVIASWSFACSSAV
jgi:hypothetical protein